LHHQPIWLQLLARGQNKPISSRHAEGPRRRSVIQWCTGHRWPVLRHLQSIRKAVKGSGTAQSRSRLSILSLIRQQPHTASCSCSPERKLASCIVHVRRGLHLNDEAVRVAVNNRVGIELCRVHQCFCGATVDRRGLHVFSCKRNPGRAQRHHFINQLIWRV
jgi:hypothetical protein